MPENDVEALALYDVAARWEEEARRRAPAPGEWHSDFSYAAYRSCAEELRRVLPDFLAQRDAAMRAEGWDEGFFRGAEYQGASAGKLGKLVAVENPYRAATDAVHRSPAGTNPVADTSESPSGTSAPHQAPASVAARSCRRCGVSASAAIAGVLCEPPFAGAHDFAETPVASVALTDEDRAELTEAEGWVNDGGMHRDAAVERIVARHVGQALGEVELRLGDLPCDEEKCDSCAELKRVSTRPCLPRRDRSHR